MEMGRALERNQTKQPVLFGYVQEQTSFASNKYLYLIDALTRQVPNEKNAKPKRNKFTRKSWCRP